MCTAISYLSNDHYFGRNLDLERSYGEAVTVTPRKFPFHFRNGMQMLDHYAIIGMAVTIEEYPLYFDATNEKGLSMAGLNFPGNAVYFPPDASKTNITPFELIPWLLGNCSTIEQAKQQLNTVNLWNEPFNSQFPNTPLHWIISDAIGSLVLESTEDGLHLYDNPVGVLTNNPPFPYHLHNLANYMQLAPDPPTNNQPILLYPYSLGMGSFGLPGDMSSGSRFIKASFTKMHSICGHTEENAVNQFFHILSSVTQQRGLTKLANGEYEYTQYSSCCNTAKGIYYYTTYENSRITAVSMHHTDLNSDKIISYPLMSTPQFLYQN